MIEPSFLALFSPLLIAQKDRATKTKTKTTEKAGRLNDSFIAFAWLVVRHLLSSPLLSLHHSFFAEQSTATATSTAAEASQARQGKGRKQEQV